MDTSARWLRLSRALASPVSLAPLPLPALAMALRSMGLVSVVALAGCQATGDQGQTRGDRAQDLDVGSRGVPQTAAEAHEAALDWLDAHQSEDGRWDADAFWAGNPPAASTDDAGHPLNDVGVTALALLAHVEAGHTNARGSRRDSVRRAANWLVREQDEETGLIGTRDGHTYHYDHALATYALAELYQRALSPALMAPLQNASSYVSRARNAYSVWRYAMPPNGENDTSVTIWMALATESAQRAKINSDVDALQDTLVWLDEMTDPASGRVGYVERGSRSSRVPGENEQYSLESAEALTAGALHTRTRLGQQLADMPYAIDQMDLLLRALPSPSGDADHLYWHYGTRAMRAAGGQRWARWRTAIEPIALRRMRTDGAFAGSWDPNGAWGYAGGRVYSTALMALVLGDCIAADEEQDSSE